MANIVGRLITVALWVIVTPLVLDRLGTERFGVWAIFFAIITTAAVLDLGVANIAGRFIALGRGAGDDGLVRTATHRAVVAGSIFGIAWGSLLVLARPALLDGFRIPGAIRSEVDAALLILGLALALFAPAQALQGVLVGFQRLDLSNLSQAGGALVHGAALVGLLAAGNGLVGAAVAAVLGQAVALMVAALLVMGLYRSLEGPALTPVGWREMLGFGATVQATNAFTSGQQNASRFLLAAMTPLATVAHFELGARVATALWSIPALIQGAVIPEAARASASAGVEGLRTVYSWACRWILAAGGLLLGGLWVSAPALFVLWLGAGSEPESAAQIARWLVFALMVAIIAGPATAVSRGGGWPHLEAIAMGAALVLNVAAGVWLIPRAGSLGAVIALGLSYSVAACWLLLKLHARIQMSTAHWLLQVLLPRLAATVLCAGATWLATHTLEHGSRESALLAVIVQWAGFFLLYAAAGCVTGDSQAVWSRLRDLMNRRRRLVHEP